MAEIQSAEEFIVAIDEAESNADVEALIRARDALIRLDEREAEPCCPIPCAICGHAHSLGGSYGAFSDMCDTLKRLFPRADRDQWKARAEAAEAELAALRSRA